MEKALFEACERQIAQMAGLGTAFPRVPTHFNPCIDRYFFLRYLLRQSVSSKCMRKVIRSFQVDVYSSQRHWLTAETEINDRNYSRYSD